MYKGLRPRFYSVPSEVTADFYNNPGHLFSLTFALETFIHALVMPVSQGPRTLTALKANIDLELKGYENWE